MESDNSTDMSRPSGGPAGARWTPTKEQIDLLEDLYRKGVRTPSAEQIQQMTSKLKAFGHIEGKNVFYWFQNHKARQRQKQKQENVALFNRLMLHRTPPPPHFATYYRNVSCHPSFYMPPPPPPPRPSEFGYHPNYMPGCYKKRSLQPETINNTLYTKACKTTTLPVNQEPMLFQEQNQSMQIRANEEPSNHQETLNLFPLHPTGNLHARRESNSTPTCNYTAIEINYNNNGSGNFGHDQPIIDFFCMDGHRKSS